MGTILTQSSLAAFPDRPVESGVGLLATLSAGEGGAYLFASLDPTPSKLHVRFMMDALSLSGGRVVLLACLDTAGELIARLGYDADNRAMSLHFRDGTELFCELNGALAWQCVELGINPASGEVGLWVDGVPADGTIGDLSGASIETVWFGAIQKQDTVAGVLRLDQWCIADGYIGPVVVAPGSEFADDPSRWLVVYNKDAPDAAAWAEGYRQRHAVPFANLAGLSLPTDETITGTQYASMANTINDYMSDNQLDGQIMGLVLGYRVPGYVDFNDDGVLEAVASLMQTNGSTAGGLANPLASPETYQRLTHGDMAGARMTARLDAPDLLMVEQLHDRSAALSANGPSSDDSIIYFDPFVGDDPGYQQAFAEMLDWATGIRGMRTRLPVRLSGDPAGNQEASFVAVSGDGYFWGWSSTLPDPDIFIAPAGRRAVCAQMYLGGATATTLRDSAAENWANVPITAGYAGVIASSRDNPVSALPDVGAFFDALGERWTLGEAWHVAQPLLRSGYYLVGDPLMSNLLPRNGYDVFGPVASFEDLDPSSPDYVLPGSAVSLDLSSNAPALGTGAHYLIRRTDARGWVESSMRSVRVVNLGGEAHRPMVTPIWPDMTDWPVGGEAGRVRLAAFWPCPIGDTRIQTIELLSQKDDQGIEVLAEPKWHPLDSMVVVERPGPLVRTRYVWRFTSVSGELRVSDPSAWFEPADAPVGQLQLIGGAL